jgi:hypothetical protein
MSKTATPEELIATALQVERRLTKLELKINALLWLNGAIVGGFIVALIMVVLK